MHNSLDRERPLTVPMHILYLAFSQLSVLCKIWKSVVVFAVCVIKVTCYVLHNPVHSTRHKFPIPLLPTPLRRFDPCKSATKTSLRLPIYIRVHPVRSLRLYLLHLFSSHTSIKLISDLNLLLENIFGQLPKKLEGSWGKLLNENKYETRHIKIKSLHYRLLFSMGVCLQPYLQQVNQRSKFATEWTVKYSSAVCTTSIHAYIWSVPLQLALFIYPFYDPLIYTRYVTSMLQE